MTVGRLGELVFVELVRRSFEEGISEIDTMGFGSAKDHLRLYPELARLIVAARLGGRGLIAARELHLHARRRGKADEASPEPPAPESEESD